MVVEPYTVSRFLHDLEGDTPFGLSRYGDGEFSAIFGEQGQTCDGQPYSVKLGNALMTSIAIPGSYNYGLVRIATKVHGDRVADTVNRLDPRGLGRWIEGTFLKDTSETGDLLPVVLALRRMKILYVGPGFLHSCLSGKDGLIGAAGFIQCPAKDAFASYASIVQTIRKALDTERYDLVGFSCGPTANVLIWELWNFYHHQSHFVDFGSLWDGFAGKNSRSYMTDEWENHARKLQESLAG